MQKIIEYQEIMMNTPIIDFLVTLPDWILVIITLVSIFLVDVFYTLWIKFVSERKKYKAGIVSAILYLCTFTGISSILEINNYLILPAVIAAFLGTVTTMKFYEKK